MLKQGQTDGQPIVTSPQINSMQKDLIIATLRLRRINSRSILRSLSVATLIGAGAPISWWTCPDNPPPWGIAGAKR